jgi:hypothetical protein
MAKISRDVRCLVPEAHVNHKDKDNHSCKRQALRRKTGKAAEAKTTTQHKDKPSTSPVTHPLSPSFQKKDKTKGFPMAKVKLFSPCKDDPISNRKEGDFVLGQG